MGGGVLWVGGVGFGFGLFGGAGGGGCWAGVLEVWRGSSETLR